MINDVNHEYYPVVFTNYELQAEYRKIKVADEKIIDKGIKR